VEQIAHARYRVAVLNVGIDTASRLSVEAVLVGASIWVNTRTQLAVAIKNRKHPDVDNETA
jgi:hypothetical protein